MKIPWKIRKAAQGYYCVQILVWLLIAWLVWLFTKRFEL